MVGSHQTSAVVSASVSASASASTSPSTSPSASPSSSSAMSTTLESISLDLSCAITTTTTTTVTVASTASIPQPDEHQKETGQVTEEEEEEEEKQQPTAEPQIQTRTRQLRDRSTIQRPSTPYFTMASTAAATTTTTSTNKPPSTPTGTRKKPVRGSGSDLKIDLQTPDVAPTRRTSKRLSMVAARLSGTPACPSSSPRSSKNNNGKRSHEVMTRGTRSAGPKLETTAPRKGGDSANGTLLRASKRSRKGVNYNDDSDSENEEEDDSDDQDNDDDNDEEEDDDGESSSRTSTTNSSEIPTQSPIKKHRKIWLKQGLYVGQPQDFDATKPPTVLAKRRSLGGGKAKVNEPPKALPLPMFTGLRIMETQRDFKLPFNVFAPSPWKCGPIHDWRKLNHNVLIGDAAGQWKREKASQAQCVCEPEKGCNEDCLNRCTWVECDAGNCAVGPEFCKNRSFADLKERVKQGTRYADGTEVVLTMNCGYGLRATRSFEPNQIIVEYTGEIITQEESERRMIEEYKENNNYYLMLFHQNMILDATRGSVARFVNHSCDPNCRMEKWLVDGKPRMALFAGDDGVEAGDELTYDYNFNWFSGVSSQACHCGAEKCRGALGKRADNTRKKPTPPVMSKAAAKAAASKRRGRPKKPEPRRQKNIIFSPKRKITKRKLPTPPPTSSSAADSASVSSSPASTSSSLEIEPPAPTTTTTTSSAPPRRSKPKIVRTYKTGKTIRISKINNGRRNSSRRSVIKKSATSTKTITAVKKQAIEQALADAKTFKRKCATPRGRPLGSKNSPKKPSLSEEMVVDTPTTTLSRASSRAIHDEENSEEVVDVVGDVVIAAAAVVPSTAATATTALFEHALTTALVNVNVKAAVEVEVEEGVLGVEVLNSIKVSA